MPKLKVDRELQMLEEGASPIEPPEEEEEYMLPDDVNIFPLVEKFTVRHHSKDMQYWACVVMRNLCRKDESRGGIRQCAYYKCGKWEEFQRQLPSVAVAAAPSTAAKIVRKPRGCIIVTGATPRHDMNG